MHERVHLSAKHLRLFFCRLTNEPVSAALLCRFLHFSCDCSGSHVTLWVKNVVFPHVCCVCSGGKDDLMFQLKAANEICTFTQFSL